MASARDIFDGHPPRNSFEKLVRMTYRAIDGPITWFRVTVVEPNRPKTKYYHRRFRRVPTLDECYVNDEACTYEAQQQFLRDMKVDGSIASILRKRLDDCVFYHRPDHAANCQHLLDDYNEASTNYFIKYGDLGAFPDVRQAFLKQKHRLIWERRHGVGGTINDVNSDLNNNNND